jgi:ABC-type bacteriocin/lantibiotic exporter with double-glycine peptidase domain
LFKNLLKIYKSIGKKNTFFFITLFPVGLVGLTFELLSIFGFIPIFQQGFGGSIISSSESLNLISNKIINYVDDQNFLIIIVLFIIIFKNIFILFQNYYFLTISKRIYLFICDRLFLNKISEDHLIFLEKSSSSFLKDLRETTVNFRIYLESLLNFFIEFSVTILIIYFLLLMNFNITISILSIFISIVFLFIIFSRNYASKIGKRLNEYAEKLNNILINSFHNFVNIKIYNKTGFFLKKYQIANVSFAENQKKIFFLYSTTKPVMELAIVFIIIIFLINSQGDKFNNYLGILGVYLVAFYRLLPSAIRVSNLKLTLNSNSFSVDMICNSINKIEYKTRLIKKIKSNIKFSNVFFSYDKNNIILKNINLIFNKNYITCLYGKSGCGKTTLVKLIAGLIKPTSGKIIIDNKFEYKKSTNLNISYVSQNCFIMKDTLAKNIAFDEDNKIDFDKIDQIIKILELDIVMKNKKINYQTTVISEDASLFSGGQRQRIAIARALYKDSDILILDESTNALDLRTEARIIKNLHSIKLNKIIIIISHRKETRRLCDYKINLS